MITAQHRAERISVAYIRAVSARAGLSLDVRELDYGVDGTLNEITKRDGRLCESGRKIDFQLKASKNWALKDGQIVYALEAKTYNDIVIRHQEKSIPRCLLILLCLPEDEEDWLKITAEELSIRKCCYWVYLEGQETSNKESVTIKIPESNRFTPEYVKALFERVRTGEPLS